MAVSSCMAASSVLLLTLFAVVAFVPIGTFAQQGYKLQYNWSGSRFFDNFDFWTQDDPTHGYVDYVDRSTAQSMGLISAGQTVYIGSDHRNAAGGRGRRSVRISSKASFNEGLVIADLTHMPEGCGTWPAFWLVGPNWPNDGEVDIIEGVNNNIANQITLHTNAGCDMGAVDPNSFTGRWATGTNGQPSTNCWVNAPNQYANQGCGIISGQGSYGAPFNQRGGGIYVTEFGHGWPIKVWFFPRDKIPKDILIGQPVPSTWGKPNAFFQIGSNCPASHFQTLRVIINLTFCGDWAGGTFGQQCPGYASCTNYVQYNPSAFTDAYWTFNSIKVYQFQ